MAENHSHIMHVVISGTPESLFEIQRELFTNAGFGDLEIKKFEIRPLNENEKR